jgi:type I restriction enzyme R subunit
MVVSIDKATALRTHDKVAAEWRAELGRVEQRLRGSMTYPERIELVALRDRMRACRHGGHRLAGAERGRGDEEARPRHPAAPEAMAEVAAGLDERFKDPADPLSIVFVCAMWLTGFDAPSCSTVYLDKPMRNHTLMQTITRANRVYPGKHSGLIVDYANVFTSLEKALAIYGAGGWQGPRRATRDELVDELRARL